VNKDIRGCALALLTVPQTCIDVPDSEICDIATISDIVMCTVLCSLANMTREDLRANVIENPNFSEWLDRSDCATYKTLLDSFFNCKWESAWRVLNAVLKEGRRDMFLSRVCAPIEYKIREKLVMQYCKPHETIKLDAMAEAFGVEMMFLESKLLQLIENGSLSARVDGVQHTVTRFVPNARTDAFESTVKAGKMFKEWTDRDLFYTSIIENGFLNAECNKPKFIVTDLFASRAPYDLFDKTTYPVFMAPAQTGSSKSRNAASPSAEDVYLAMIEDQVQREGSFGRRSGGDYPRDQPERHGSAKRRRSPSPKSRNGKKDGLFSFQWN